MAHRDLDDRVEAVLDVVLLALVVVEQLPLGLRDGAAAAVPAPRVHGAVLEQRGEGVQRTW